MLRITGSVSRVPPALAAVSDGPAGWATSQLGIERHIPHLPYHAVLAGTTTFVKSSRLECSGGNSRRLRLPSELQRVNAMSGQTPAPPNQRSVELARRPWWRR